MKQAAFLLLKLIPRAPKAYVNHGLPKYKPGSTNQAFLIVKPELLDFTI